jgi:putative hemolysin
MISFIIIIITTLTISFICSLIEAALLSLTPSQVAILSSKRPRAGLIWQSFKSNIERPIAVILVINSSAITIGAAVAGAQFNRIFGSEYIWLFSVIFMLLMLQFTEIMPKTIGVRYNRELAGIIARPLNATTAIFSPLLRLLRWFNRPFEPKRTSSARPATIDEISALAGLARLSNQIGLHQERIIKGTPRLSELSVRQVMIPVDHVSFLSTTQTLPEALITAHMDAHTRFPVREGEDNNRVVGYINFKEMIYFMRMNPNDQSLRGIIRPVHFVSPEDSAATLLQVFTDEHVHIAVVRDANSKTLGLVTLEDLVEELVGELEDEFDRLPKMFHPLSGGIWMIGGGMSVSEISQKLGITIVGAAGTISEWLGARLNHIPKPGDTYREGGAEFVVRRVRRGRIFEVAVSRSQVTSN